MMKMDGMAVPVFNAPVNRTNIAFVSRLNHVSLSLQILEWFISCSRKIRFRICASKLITRYCSRILKT